MSGEAAGREGASLAGEGHTVPLQERRLDRPLPRCGRGGGVSRTETKNADYHVFAEGPLAHSHSDAAGPARVRACKPDLWLHPGIWKSR